MTTRARVTTDLGVVSEMDGDGGIDDQFHMVHAIVRPGRHIEFTVRVTRSLDCPDGGRP
jgi:hypothetical protein